MATFRVDFLGCKVSQADVREGREALLRDGHDERRDRGAQVAVISTCCGANLADAVFADIPENVTVVAKPSEATAGFVAGDVGAIGCVQAAARIDRVRAFVKIQDGCSFACNFCVIPLVRGASRSRSESADPVSPAAKKERAARLRALSHELCLRRWQGNVGADDSVLVDRPGRGYGDDYTPWPVDANVGELVRVRGAAVTEEGVRAEAA